MCGALVGGAAILAPGLAQAAAPTSAVAGPVSAESEHDSWGAMAETMDGVLEAAYAAFQGGDLEGGRDGVNDAYYSYYEAGGFEKTVMAYVSGSAATEVEYEFGVIKKLMLDGGPDAEVRQHIDTLETMLDEQAATLDGSKGSASPTKLFADALLIMLREGFEAILVLGAIIAYLVKSGARKRLPLVWTGAGLAVAASFALAIAVNAITALAGANQEIIEGATVLLACAMLIWVSTWMAAKAGGERWSAYLQSKAATSNRSVWGLAGVAFLAVFREGAEVILLVQALRAQAGASSGMVWAGLGAGAVALVFVYLAIRLLSIRLPLRPFFMATSVLLAVMAVSFAGSGVKELQEGDALGMTPLSGCPTISLLGIYPTAEGLIAQVIALAVVVAGFFAVHRRNRARAALTPTPPALPTANSPSTLPPDDQPAPLTPSAVKTPAGAGASPAPASAADGTSSGG
jgi:high-affinity iron transporter